MNWKEWLLPASLMAAGGAASALVSIDNRLVNAVVAVAAIAMAWMLAQRGLSQRARLLVAVLSSVAGLTALIAYNSYENACTATNAADQRVVIGTELTEAGLRYKQDHRADDKELLESLGERSVEWAWTTASIRRCRLSLAVSGALWIPLFGVAAVAATSATRIGRRDTGAAPGSSKPRAFISYTHDDAATALRLTQRLRQHKIDVIIDTESIAPGERITDFIDRSIRECDVVVSLISSRSLVSPWVASEAIAGIARNRWGREVTLVACYLDDQWQRPEFRLECTRQIDDRLSRIEDLLAEYAAKKIDPADLNDEQSRLYTLRNSLGDILARLKNSLCLDVREEQFEASAKRLVATILASQGPT